VTLADGKPGLNRELLGLVFPNPIAPTGTFGRRTRVIRLSPTAECRRDQGRRARHTAGAGRPVGGSAAAGNTQRRYAQKRKTIAAAKPTTLAEMLSAAALVSPSA
jgi:hypothetical protein